MNSLAEFDVIVYTLQVLPDSRRHVSIVAIPDAFGLAPDTR